MVKNIKVEYQDKNKKERKTSALPDLNSRIIRASASFKGNDRLVLSPRNNSDTNIHILNARSSINPEKRDNLNELQTLIHYNSKNIEYLNSLESYSKFHIPGLYFDAQNVEQDELRESITTKNYENQNALRINSSINPSHLNSPYGKNISNIQNHLQIDEKPNIKCEAQINSDEFIGNNLMTNSQNKNSEMMPAPGYNHFYKESRGIISQIYK
ncbi:hypothetical protein AYI69_g5894 [Smittium culicis]|uniref:Uncharacterized protein n=1 Tax=Smittium culicis TaxID=133412 RepID=A0A1R1Y2R7_9FUNG|nr:hypothetical protein AYI69_g5894 [Smittium culicis]